MELRVVSKIRFVAGWSLVPKEVTILFLPGVAAWYYEGRFLNDSVNSCVSFF